MFDLHLNISVGLWQAVFIVFGNTERELRLTALMCPSRALSNGALDGRNIASSLVKANLLEHLVLLLHREGLHPFRTCVRPSLSQCFVIPHLCAPYALPVFCQTR